MDSKLFPFTGTVRLACQTIVYYVFIHCRVVGGYKCPRVTADEFTVGLPIK